MLTLTTAVCQLRPSPSLPPGLLQHCLSGSLTLFPTGELHPRGAGDQQPARVQHSERQQDVSEGGLQTGHSPLSR